MENQTQTNQAAQAFAQSIAGLATQSIADALVKTESKCDALINEVTSKLSTIKSNFIGIKINDLEPIITKHRPCLILEDLIRITKVGLNPCMVGPSGCGKTFAAEQLSEVLKLNYAHVTLTAGASESWLFGRQTPTGFIEGQFSKFYRLGGVFLLDEVDAADPNMVLCLNTALGNGHLYNPINGETYTRHKDFVCIAAANTNLNGADNKYTGRSRIDAAFSKRFIFVAVDYDTDLENDMLHASDFKKCLFEIRSQLKSNQFDEILSSRDFENSQKLINAGFSHSEILYALIFNWSDAAKKMAVNVFDDMVEDIPQIKPENQTTPSTIPQKRGRGRPVGWRKLK